MKNGMQPLSIESWVLNPPLVRGSDCWIGFGDYAIDADENLKLSIICCLYTSSPLLLNTLPAYRATRQNVAQEMEGK